jgi:hypothetical protein
VNSGSAGGKVIFFLVGILFGIIALFLLAYFFWPQQCCGAQQSVPQGDTTIIRDSGGNVITYNAGDQGTSTTYTDPSGRERELLCYESLYCVEQCPGCSNETCDSGECVQDGSYCGYGTVSRTSVTRLTDSSTFYGGCCDGSACVNGYCQRGTCVNNDGLCGYGPTSNTAVVNNPTYYGECCAGYDCIDGFCTPPTQDECSGQGASCAYGATDIIAVVPDVSPYYGRCCSDMACIRGICEPPAECTDLGSFCGYGPTTYTNDYQAPAYYGTCCGDNQCVNGYCTPPGQTCIQTGATCGYGTAYTTVAPPPGATYYGTCCQGDYCYNGMCTPEGGCSAQGETCAAGQVECCEGYTCTNGMCATPCTTLGSSCTYDSECCAGTWCSDGTCSNACISAVGASCTPGRRDCCGGMQCQDGLCNRECSTSGSCSSASDCCDGYYCSDNMQCTPNPTCETAGRCSSDSDCCSGYVCGETGYCTVEASCYDSDGSSYYTPNGYTYGYFDGILGTYYDYCTDYYHMVEYTCSAASGNVVSTPYTCAYGCADGGCIQYYQPTPPG